MEGRDQRDLQNIVRRAKTSPDKTGSLRRNALRQLIEATHSSSSQVKIYAANSIPDFFQDFPDLEEDSINAVYDLCEDQVMQVRMEGYKTLAILSKSQKKLVKRNADVLVQLLQTDEPNEVNVVKKALIEHLHMDPHVTLGVLCDQLRPPEDAMDQEDTAHLRKLVINFLSAEVKKGSLQRIIPPNSEGEHALIEGLVGAIHKLDSNDIQAIVDEILLQLPSFSHPSMQGFGQAVLERAKMARESDLYTTEKSATLNKTRPYLEMLSKIFIDKRLGSTEELLKFYNPLFGKPVLQKISPDDRVLAIYYLAEAVVASPQSSMIVQNMLKVSQACFEFLTQADLSQERPIKASLFLLRSSMQLLEGGWQMPPLVVNAIEGLGRALNMSKSAQSQEIQELLRSIALKTQATNIRKRVLSSPSPSASSNNIKSLPSRPPSFSLPRRPSGPIEEITSSTSLPGPSRAADTTIIPNMKTDDRPAKKARKFGEMTAPSLLSRLSTGSAMTPKHPLLEKEREVEASPTTQFSIKGAASRTMDSEGQTSLMTRLNGTSSSATEQTGRSRKRKKGFMQ